MLLSNLHTTDYNEEDTSACHQSEPDETRDGALKTTRLCSPPSVGCTIPCYLIPVPELDDDCKKYAQTLPPPHPAGWKDWKCCALDRECEKARFEM